MGVSIAQHEDFISLFSGSESAYGRFVPLGKDPESAKMPGKCTTERGLVGDEQYKEHFNGTIGLGLIPIREDNTVVFSVIDVDEYRLSLEKIVFDIHSMGLPIMPFRSKSGGLHLYLFYKVKTPAKIAIQLMQTIKTLLGLSDKTEIFPKQKALGQGELGNWINLPYFDSDNTDRYLYTKDFKPCSLAEALETINKNLIDVEKVYDIIDVLPLADAPPCLQTIYLRGDTESRNHYLFSLARYFKTKFGDEFEKHVIEANFALLRPLPLKEVTDTVISAHKKKDYCYKCGEDPILSLCNKSVCRKREYGIGGNEMSNLSYEEFYQVMTDPPYYEWMVNKKLLKFFSEADIINQGTFRSSCFRELHVLPNKLKDDVWTRIVNTALHNVIIKKVATEEDISPGAMLKEHLVEYLTKRAMAQSRSQILIDHVYRDEQMDAYIFKAKNFLSFLNNNKKFNYYGQTEIHSRLLELQCAPIRYYVDAKNKNSRVWAMPAKMIELLSSDSDVPTEVKVDFTNDFKGEDY